MSNQNETYEQQMKDIDMHERLKRSLAANLVLSDQVDEQEKQIAELMQFVHYVHTHAGTQSELKKRAGDILVKQE